MRYRAHILALVATLAALLAAGCGNPLNPTAQDEVGSLLVSFQNPRARTIEPDTDTDIA